MPSRQRIFSGLLGALLACEGKYPEPVLERVEPARLSRRVAAEIALHGRGFAATVHVDFDRPSSSEVDARFQAELSGPSGAQALREVVWLEPGQLTAVVPAELPAGKYALRVVDPRGRESTLDAALELVDCVADADCNAGASCDRFRCAAGACEPLPPPATGPYADLDGDGVGDGEALACPGDPVVAAAGDCDDGDPFTWTGAPEICDRRDNDCDGATDEGGACPATAGWNLRTDTGGSGEDWRVASAWKAGAVWLAGPARAYVRDNPGSFLDKSAGCVESWTAAWADSASGAPLYLGATSAGGTMVLAERTQGAATCVTTPLSVAGTVVGLTGVGHAANLEVFGVVAMGGSFRWRPRNGAVDYQLPLGSVALTDVAGTELDRIFAVGGSVDAPTSPRVFRYDAAARVWSDQRVQDLPGAPEGRLRGIWVAGPSLVVAVGDAGAVVRWDGRSWRWLAGPGAATLVATVALGANQIHVLDQTGAIHRRSAGGAWEALASPGGGVWNDLTGTAPDDLWAVGDDGAVLRWP